MAKLVYDKEANAYYIYFKQADIKETLEALEGKVFIDIDKDNEIIGVEILGDKNNKRQRKTKRKKS